MRIAGHDEGIDADILIFPDPRRDGLGIADQRGARAAAHQADAGPEIGTDLELVAASAMQLRHALLADRIHPREDLLRRSHRFVGDVLDQFVRRLPGFRIGFAHDHMQADAERELSSARGGGGLHPVDLLGDLRRRLAPGQVLVDGIDGDVDAGIRRSAEIERRPRRLHRLEQQPAVLDADVLALDIDGLAREQVAVDVEELARHLVALVMDQEDAVALVLDRIAAGDDIDQQTSVRHPIERRGHARGDARRLQPGPHRHQIAQPLGPWRHGRGDHPGILAASPRRQQHAEIAELIGGLRDLAQIVEVHLASAGGGAEIAAVAMGRQEPEDIGVGLRAHDPDLRATSEILICFGMSPSAKNVSATCCWSLMTLSVIGLMP